METTWENMPISSSRHHHRNPSFSSSLLDQIYRSIDDDSTTTNQNHRKTSLHEHRELSPKLVFHRRSVAADFDRSSKTTTTTTVRYSNSTSSDSSGFSSSESDSFYNTRSKSSVSPRQPKPIRTSLDNNSGVQKPNSKQDLGGFLRTKSKALKIYTDLKKVKQPTSPGGKLATFLNSLFTNTNNTNTKKHKKTTTTTAVSEPQSTISSTCSSASSFSRSCLSKTPSSSSGKSKRSVRFCPVNVILDEEYSSNVHLPHRHVMEEENRRVIEAAKDLLRSYRKNKDHHLEVTTTRMTKFEDVEEEEDYDDAASCASSDLFELENLSAIGIERYREELPVYETTRMDHTNRAVATSLIV